MLKNMFKSTKTAIGLLIIIALSCIIGTVIPQNVPDYNYIIRYGEIIYRFLKLTSLIDVYHSWWFIGLLTLLGIDIIGCSLYRHSSLLNKDAGKMSVLQNKRIGAYITHASILIILIGGITGGLTGFKEHLEINEKDTVKLPHTNIYLKVEDFSLEYYPNSLMPKDYKSTLTIIEQGKKVLTKTIEVNHPLVYKGIWIYQSSHGMSKTRGSTPGSGGTHGNRITIQASKDNGKWIKKFHVKTGDEFHIPQTNTTIKIAQFLPDFVMDGKKIYSRSEKFNNPAVELQVYDGNRLKTTHWAFYNFQNYHQVNNMDIKLKLIGFESTEFTGLQIVKDPSVPIVWTGCGLLMLGLMVSFGARSRGRPMCLPL
ncbi:cytochrome c biogenesis protein ResB [bacterium]|nr:cytochrome c biogenesis protein ResB [bacterium]